ncbi:hypothetical protein C3747_209g74 [Trypanosoma cruzi]|uniref:Target of rapamycin (TOR) kinase 1 n=1 Tax=Trypanosoma cruzi TaxID=5693 RepID=A0A2V2VVB6_TRYCR|nr:hypothetical protein C3747_209g74 [Trypanosoma cruzi]RNC40204.1 hypothetical protein TcCL_NonESM10353 [Trypanosoma cruzi]
MSALNFLTIAEMEVTASRVLPAAAILGTRLCDYHFFKAVQRRLSALNREIVQEKSPANLPPVAIGLDERLRHIIENIIVGESSSPRRRHWPPSSRTHRSMDGKPFLFQTSVTLKLPEGKWRGSLFLSCRPSCARYAWPYRHFPPSCHPPWTFGWTILRCKERQIQLKITSHGVGAATDI